MLKPCSHTSPEDHVSGPYTSNLRSTGRHTRGGYVLNLVTLWRARKSGILQVRFGRRRQKIFIVSGVVVACKSYAESDGERDVEVTGPDGVAAALSWATGDWTFQPYTGVEDIVDPALRADSTLAEIWRSVLVNFPASEAMPAMAERAAAPLEPGMGLGECFPGFGVEAPLDRLPRELGDGTTVEALFQAFPDAGGDLARAIWLLDEAGLLDPQDATYTRALRELLDVREIEDAPSVSISLPAPSSVVRRVESRRVLESRPVEGRSSEGRAAQQRSGEAPASKNPSRDLAGILLAEHERRMGRDYYGFLGVASNAPQLLVNRLCKRYLQRWRSASANRSLPEEARILAADLFNAVQQISDVLTDPARREEYDRLLARNDAPVVKAGEGIELPELEPIPEEPISRATTPHQRGQELLERGEYAAALPYLEKARQGQPSDPDVLSDLGWASWMIQGSGGVSSGPQDPEDYIRLALTFDNRNRRALEYLARIAMAGEDGDLQQKRLKDFLRVAPDEEWAREALKSVMFTRKDSSESGRGLRFWRKGSSH
jgi:tetratricopeptide (TPR) repeat protein